MKKTFFIFSLFLFSNLFGDINNLDGCSDYCRSRWLIDANVGYFYPFSKSLRKTITGGVDYQLMITRQWRKQCGVFLSGDFFYNDRHSSAAHTKYSLWILPITLGIRVSKDLWCSCDQSQILKGYFLLGPRWYIACSRNSASFMKHHAYGNGPGGMGGIGLSYLYRDFTLNAILNLSFGNLRANYSQKYVEKLNTQVGGLVIGGGCGWNF